VSDFFCVSQCVPMKFMILTSTWSISSGAQYVTLQKYFSLPSRSSYLFTKFSNPIHKVEAGAANKWETTNSKPARPIIMMDQSKNESRSKMILHSCTVRCYDLLCLLPASANARPQPFY